MTTVLRPTNTHENTRDEHVDNMTFNINTGNPSRDATQMLQMPI